MEIRYAVTETVYKIGSLRRRSFGVAAVVLEDGQITVLDSVEDLCEDGGATQRFAELCDSQHADPVHLRELVEDFLAGH